MSVLLTFGAGSCPGGVSARQMQGKQKLQSKILAGIPQGNSLKILLVCITI